MVALRPWHLLVCLVVLVLLTTVAVFAVMLTRRR